MVKIELDLPDWVDARNIRVFAGIEEVARRMKRREYWEIKTARCSICGECCKHTNAEWPRGATEIDGKWVCNFLAEPKAGEARCALLKQRPFMCCATDHAGEDYCSVKWERVDGSS